MKPQIAMSKQNKFKYRIYYEDTDSGGVVYYANYLKFFERARTDYLRSRGINQNDLAKTENTVFVVRKAEIDYISPAKLDDLIEVCVKITEISAVSIIMEQKITINDKTLNKLHVKIASVSADEFKPKKISDNLKEILS